MATKNATIEPTRVIDLARVEEGDEVGYLGCGSGGYLTVPLSQRVGATGKIYAVDILPEALVAVKKIVSDNNLTNVETVWSNLEIYGATKILARSLHVAILVNMLYQNKDKVAVFKEVDRLVRVGGVILVVEWLPEQTSFGPPQNLRVQPENIDNTLISLGYELKDSGLISDFHYCRIYQKR